MKEKILRLEGLPERYWREAKETADDTIKISTKVQDSAPLLKTSESINKNTSLLKSKPTNKLKNLKT